MWRKNLDPSVKVLSSTSSSVLPIILTIPGVAQTAHISLYLTTSGQDAKFVSALSALEISLQHICEEYACPIFIRGDFNLNPNNKKRAGIFKHFCEKHNLSGIDFLHPSHHHFTGNGASDSQLDLLLFSGPSGHAETLNKVVCGLVNPIVNSHHDVIISSFPLVAEKSKPPSGYIKGPRVLNERVKILWDDSKIQEYESLVSPCLSRLRQKCAEDPSPTVFKASALWADAFSKSKCPYVCVFVCVFVCLSVHF